MKGAIGRRPRALTVGLLCAVVMLLSFSAPIGHTATNGPSASKVIGQKDFVSSLNPPNSLRVPTNVVFDSSGDMWLSDQQNNRVLEFKPPFATGMSPSLVLGQPNYATYFSKVTQSGLSLPAGIRFDASGNLWVVDTYSNRILEFRSPFATGMNASLVIGQSDFTSNGHATSQSSLYYPNDAAFDSAGNLWVSDELNNRILEFKFPFSTGMSSSSVIGQANFTSGSKTTTQNGLSAPSGEAFDSAGNLWVADLGNNRVLDYAAPLSSGMTASMVLGQVAFTTSSSGITASTLDHPFGLLFDGNSSSLWVSDTFNNRVLEFRGPFSNGESASLVIGQATFTSNTALNTRGGFYNPAAVGLDGARNLWVADESNNRVLEFSSPLSTDENASMVLGQADYVANILGGNGSLRIPRGEAFDHSGNLWVSDELNNRILEFRAPLTVGMNASLVIGQPDFRTNYGDVGRQGLYLPEGIAFDSGGNLWVADTYNHRVLEFTYPFSDGMNASLVIGQSSFSASSAGAGASALTYPSDVALDRTGNLWVLDLGNSRVLEFKTPLSSGMSASMVLGQTGFNSINPGTSQSQMSYPSDMAFDSSQDLWISDTLNNRVLEFRPPFFTGMIASVAVGQPDFASNNATLSQSGLDFPNGLTFDGAGNLWLSDSFNNRLLKFQAPYATGMKASMVIGQPDYTTSVLATGPHNMRGPGAIAFDAGGNLWVADKFNNRMLEFLSILSPNSTTLTSSASTTTSTFSSFSSSSTASSTTSNVPEFPVGLPLVFIAGLLVAMLSNTYWKRNLDRS